MRAIIGAPIRLIGVLIALLLGPLVRQFVDVILGWGHRVRRRHGALWR